MKVKVTPSKVHGNVKTPASKSMAPNINPTVNHILETTLQRIT